MKNRLRVRESVQFAARLIQDGQVIATAQVINISPDGLAVELHNVVLETGQKVDVELYKQGHPRGISCWVPAMEVVHTGLKTAGLMAAHDPSYQMLSPEHCVQSIVADEEAIDRV